MSNGLELPSHQGLRGEVRAPLTAVVLGGGTDALAREVGVAAKALVPFAGRPLVDYVLEALEGCPEVGRIVYVGADDRVVRARAARCVPPGETFIESFSAGLESARALGPTLPILLTTADLPWLRSDALQDFLHRAGAADLAYPIVRKRVAEAQFPRQRRTYVKLREGRFTGGNMMLLSPEMVPRLVPFVERAYRGRKNPLVLAQLFGFDFILRLLTGRLALRAVEARAEKVLGLPVRAIETPFAGIAADVDKLEHLQE